MLLLAGLPVLAGCSGPAGSAATATAASVSTPVTSPAAGYGSLNVFAAASLREAFTTAAESFAQESTGIPRPQFNFAGSQALVAQLEQGAPADVFASADKTSMDKAVAARVVAGSPRELARNGLVVVLPGDNPAGIGSLHDLAGPDLKIALADPSVPAGSYSLQLLDKLSADPGYGPEFKDKVLANVVSREDNVRQVLTRVQLGQVDAGIVYRTDAAAANASAGGAVGTVKTLDIPAGYNVEAIYYIAPIEEAAHPAAARGWIDYILSEDGQALLEKYGFAPAGDR